MDPEIQAELERLAGTSALTGDSLDRLTSSIRSGFPDWNRANGNIRLLGNTVGESEKKVKTAFDKFKNGLSSSYNEIKSGFKSLGNESESGAKSIKNITDSLGNAVSGFASQFGMIGGFIGGAASAVTGMTGVALGFVDELTTTNKKLNEAGAAFGASIANYSGIDEFDLIVKQNQLSASILTNVLEQSSESLRLFSGGTANGLRTVAKGFNQLKTANNGQYESLVKLGYSTEEMMQGMADFGAAARLAGRDLSTEELAKGTADYLKMQRELTRLTGTSVKEAKSREEALKADIAYRQMLREIGSENAGIITNVLSNVDESLQPLVKTLLTGGQVTDQQMALIQQAMGDDFVNAIRGIGEEARSGLKLDSKVITDQFEGAFVSARQNFDKTISQYGDAGTLQTYINAGGKMGEFLTAIGPVAAALDRVKSASEATTDRTSDVANGMGRIATALPEIEKASIALRSALYTTGSTLTAVFAPLIAGLAGTVEGGAAAIQESLTKVTTGYDKASAIMAQQVGDTSKFAYASEEARQAAANKAIAESIGTIGDNTMFAGLFDKLGNTVSTAITQGMDKVLDSILPGYETSEEEVNEALDAIKEFGISSGRAAARLAELDEVELTQLNEALKKQGLGEVAKEKQIVERQFGTRGGMRTQKVSQDVWVQKPPKPQALGDIFPYKPGGEIVRVAEASPEVVMPASRGPDGKIGVEVSGAMLDNSRLLQSLVKVNEGQASLIASLNDKMNNMSNHMENLVSAQRQANRLAV